MMRKLEKMVQVRVSKSMLEQIELAAKNLDTRPSNVIRMCISVMLGQTDEGVVTAIQSASRGG